MPRPHRRSTTAAARTSWRRCSSRPPRAGRRGGGAGSRGPAARGTVAAGGAAVRRAGIQGPAAEAIVGLGSIAFAVEVFAWSERHSDTALARALRRPGHEIQRLVGTREPTAEQLEVGQAALDEILRAEGAAP